MLPATAIQPMKTARAADFERITFLILDSSLCGGMPLLDQLLASFFVALVKIGYGQISAPFDAIQNALIRLTRTKRGKGRSTLYESMARLQTAGLLWRKHCHLGDHRLSTDIVFTGKFISHISACVQNRDSNKLTSNRVFCKPRECFSNVPARANEDRYDQRESKNHPKSKKWETEHPIIRSLRCTARGKIRRYVIARAMVELLNPKLRSSSVDWSKWVGQWGSMTVAEREEICRSRLIPELADRQPITDGGSPKPPVSSSAPMVSSTPATPPPSGLPLNELIAALCGDLETECDQHPIPVCETPKPAGMSQADYEILLEASRRTRRQASWKAG